MNPLELRQRSVQRYVNRIVSQVNQTLRVVRAERDALQERLYVLEAELRSYEGVTAGLHAFREALPPAHQSMVYDLGEDLWPAIRAAYRAVHAQRLAESRKKP